GSLRNPPLFRFQGPDDATVGVWLDPWASNKFNYTQGSQLLKDPAARVPEWVAHYRALGKEYPCLFALASGTHGDIGTKSGSQAAGFARAIIDFNRGADGRVRLINSTVPQFVAEVAR